MARPNWQQRTGVTPGRLVLVGVLAAVLLTVIGYQVHQHWPAADPETAAREDGVEEKETASTTTVPVSVAAEIPWPEFGLEELQRHDPFRLPRPVVTQVAAGDDAEQALVQEAPEVEITAPTDHLRVEMIVAGANGAFATINSQQVRIGDAIEGYIVKDIRPDGVILVKP